MINLLESRGYNIRNKMKTPFTNEQAQFIANRIKSWLDNGCTIRATAGEVLLAHSDGSIHGGMTIFAASEHITEKLFLLDQIERWLSEGSTIKATDPTGFQFRFESGKMELNLTVDFDFPEGKGGVCYKHHIMGLSDFEDAGLYPCNDCGKPRSKQEGGTTFTVCDECWAKNKDVSLVGVSIRAGDEDRSLESVDPPSGSSQKELEHLINCMSLENGSDTPDFILAEYLHQCLEAFDAATRRREEWYSPEPSTELTGNEDHNS